MTKDEALKLALEALHGFIPYLPLNDEAQCGRYDEALIAIKEALAQPEQAPMHYYRADAKGNLERIDIHFAQPEHEPVAWMVYTQEGQSAFVTDNPAQIHSSQRALPLYTTPPQRTWVGLTDEEKLHIEIMGGKADVMLAEMVEAKLKEKNT